jgi:DNA modification methylase
MVGSMSTIPTEWPAGTVYESPSWPCRLVAFDYLGTQRLFETGRPKADLIFADPPYNIGVKYADDPSKDKMTLEEYQRFTKQTVLDLMTQARPGATLWWMVPEEHADWVGTILSNLVGPRLYRIVWYESFAQYQGAKGLTKDYRFIFVHEVAHDLSGEVTWNPDDIRIPSARELIYKDKRAGGKKKLKGKVPGTSWEFNDRASHEEMAALVVQMLTHAENDDQRREMIAAALAAAKGLSLVPGDVWQFRRLQGTSKDRVEWHPAQLPPELLARIVKGWTKPGDLVVDAFAGSGSLAKVCRPLGRRFMGVERSPTYLTKMAEELST